MAPTVLHSWRKKKEFVKQKKFNKAVRELKLQQIEKLKKKNDSILNSVTEETTSRAVARLKTAPTISIALPGSILENTQTDILKSVLASQVARAACIYNIDEVIIFNDYCEENNKNREWSNSWQNCVHLGRLLQYLECPQYLRKYLFPICDDLKNAGIMNPLDAPHHLRATDQCPYREGVIVERTSSSGTKSYAEVGLSKPIRIDRQLTPGTRLTLKLKRSSKKDKLRGEAVNPRQPTLQEGLYWGYRVRLASSLANVFTEAPHPQGYDLTLGTSDKGEPWSALEVVKFEHGLIVFGGMRGLEFALDNDTQLRSQQVDDIKLVFDWYVNTCPTQGARTVRTEEALLISLALLTHQLGLS